MKLFKQVIGPICVVSECQELFSFNMSSVQLARRKRKFCDKLESYRTSLFIVKV